MRFKSALIFSLGLHLSAFAVALLQPGKSSAKGEMTYYVDLVDYGSGGGRRGGGDNGAAKLQQATDSVKKLRAIGTEEDQGGLRYPDKEAEKKGKSAPRKVPPKKDEELNVVKRSEPGQGEVSGQEEGSGQGGGLRTGLGVGPGGEGSGSGQGGYGSGLGGGYFPYAYYVDILKNKVSGGWYSGNMQFRAKGKFSILVYFKIRRNGQISDLEVEKSSGLSELDLTALRAVQQAAPFPPLPRDFQDDFLVVHLEFFWEQ